MRQFHVCIFIFLFSLLEICIPLTAQVTIGSAIKPVPGAILDLKEDGGIAANSKKGLLLPRVSLEKAKELLPCVKTSLTPTEKEKFTGLMLYNTATVFPEKICPGIYVWATKSWERLYGNCEGFTVANLKSEYVMDGLEHSFVLKSFNKWTAVFSNTQGAIQTMTSLTSGNEGEFEFKFTMAIKTDADASATLTFVNEIGAKEIVTINGKKMTLSVPGNISANVDGLIGGATSADFKYSSNSSRPITVSGVPAWTKIANEKISVSGNLGGARSAEISISNGAITKKVTVSEEALVFNMVYTTLGFYAPGTSWGFLNPGITTNSKRTITYNNKPDWLEIKDNGLMGPPWNSSSYRETTVSVGLDNQHVKNLRVYQLGGFSIGFLFAVFNDDSNKFSWVHASIAANTMTQKKLKVFAPPLDGRKFVRATLERVTGVGTAVIKTQFLQTSNNYYYVEVDATPQFAAKTTHYKVRFYLETLEGGGTAHSEAFSYTF